MPFCALGEKGALREKIIAWVHNCYQSDRAFTQYVWYQLDNGVIYPGIAETQIIATIDNILMLWSAFT